jgi:hypothetical protein
VRRAPATSCAMKLLVAATLFSSPACSGNSHSAARASGEAASLTKAQVTAPPLRKYFRRLHDIGTLAGLRESERRQALASDARLVQASAATSASMSPAGRAAPSPGRRRSAPRGRSCRGPSSAAKPAAAAQPRAERAVAVLVGAQLARHGTSGASRASSSMRDIDRLLRRKTFCTRRSRSSCHHVGPRTGREPAAVLQFQEIGGEGGHPPRASSSSRPTTSTRLRSARSMVSVEPARCRRRGARRPGTSSRPAGPACIRRRACRWRPWNRSRNTGRGCSAARRGSRPGARAAGRE